VAFAMHWDWAAVCGSNDSLIIWEHGDFSPCFEALAIVCTTHALLAIISAFHFGRHQHLRIRGTIPPQYSLHLRHVVCSLLFLCPLLVFILVYLYEKVHPSPVQIITWCVQACSWMMHSAFVWRLRRLFHIHIRGPTSTVISYLLAAATDILHMRSAILQIEHSTSIFTRVEQVFAFIKCFLHLLYILSLIPHKRPSFSSGLANSANVNSREEESQNLLDEQQGASYGNIGPGVDRASWLSCLLFWWVSPLMQRGYRGGLESPSDLFMLPKNLKTDLIDEKMRIMMGAKDSFSMPDEVLDYANSVDIGHRNADVPAVAFAGQEKLCLISCLNKAFGWHYYPLGLLKFFSDALGFCGPLLLNLLVTYMEKPEEPTKDGLIYAAILFSTTLISALLSSHFNYQISVVGLRIRAAILSSVYRKALAASSVSMSTFSSGEIVNFMSSDIDRMVNFCPSFHQFWSLPVQVGVALYLLHQQLGLAFLAGLAVTVLLIPFNRCIAIKIGQLSERMMRQKDARVKVNVIFPITFSGLYSHCSLSHQVMNEVLSGIRVIKFFAWEETFARRVLGLREAELGSLKGRKYLDALCVYFWATTPVLISVLSFMTYALLGHHLTAAKVNSEQSSI
jgi:ATP-binding cassette subfamily C (CFTR/MRP) protein 10